MNKEIIKDSNKQSKKVVIKNGYKFKILNLSVLS